VSSRAVAGEAHPRRYEADDPEFQRYFQGIAEAHYVIRKVLRLVDEQAKRADLDPLEHKLLVQAFGVADTPLQVNEAATRLDIPPALASRLIRSLEAKGLVTRLHSDEDRRVTRVTATDAARELLADVDRDVREQIDFFQRQLTDAERSAALRIFALYLGTSAR
jgi:DNA-binding MarR family transcriptional regulator